MSENRIPEEKRTEKSAEKNVFEEIREKAEPVIDKITDVAKPVISDIADAAKPAFDKVVDAAKRVGERIDDKIDDLTDGEKNGFFRDLKQEAQDQKAKAAADAEAMQQRLRDLMNGGK